MVSAAHEAVLVVDAMGEQLTMQGLGAVLEMKDVFITTLEVDIETGSGDEVAVAFGDGTRMVVVEMVGINRVPEQLDVVDSSIPGSRAATATNRSGCRNASRSAPSPPIDTPARATAPQSRPAPVVLIR